MGSFRGQFGDNFRVGDHFGGCKEAKQGVGLMYFQLYRVTMVSETYTAEP